MPLRTDVLDCDLRAADPAAPSDGEFWYNATAGTHRARQGGVTVDVPGAGGGGFWSKTGTAVHPTTIGDDVVIGASATVGAERLRVAGDVRIEGAAVVTGLISQATGLNVIEQGAVPGGPPAANSGTIWARSSDSRLIFTDDTPTTNVLAYVSDLVLTSSAGDGFQPQSHRSAAVDPTVNDDSTAGYAVGSYWVNTTSDRSFKCVDASAGTAIWNEDATVPDLLESPHNLVFRFDPNANGPKDMLGWYETSDTLIALASGSPVTPSMAGYHAHYALNVTGAAGLPFTIRFTGTSINESTGALNPGATEDITVTANGYYQTGKSWINAPSISIVEAAKSCTIDVYRLSYWDAQNTDFRITGGRVEFLPNTGNWDITIEVIKVEDDGSLTYIDNTTFASTDVVPRAANGLVGKYKRGNYATLVYGSSQNEGIVLRIDQTGIESVLIILSYDHEV